MVINQKLIKQSSTSCTEAATIFVEKTLLHR